MSEQNYEEDDEYLKTIESVETLPNILIGNIQVCRCAVQFLKFLFYLGRNRQSVTDMLHCVKLNKHISWYDNI